MVECGGEMGKRCLWAMVRNNLIRWRTTTKNIKKTHTAYANARSETRTEEADDTALFCDASAGCHGYETSWGQTTPVRGVHLSLVTILPRCTYTKGVKKGTPGTQLLGGCHQWGWGLTWLMTLFLPHPLLSFVISLSLLLLLLLGLVLTFSARRQLRIDRVVFIYLLRMLYRLYGGCQLRRHQCLCDHEGDDDDNDGDNNDEVYSGQVQRW